MYVRTMLRAARARVCAVAHTLVPKPAPDRPPGLGAVADGRAPLAALGLPSGAVDGNSAAAQWPPCSTSDLEPGMGINKEQVNGRVAEAKGRVKEVTGRIIGDKDLAVKGEAQKIAGVVLATVGDAEEAVKKARKRS
jgi:uncharacterized protein YjbJ (UPF0337 family)